MDLFICILQLYIQIYAQIIWVCLSNSYLDLSCDVDLILGCFDIGLLSVMTRFRLLVVKWCFSSGRDCGYSHYCVSILNISLLLSID